MEAIWQRGRLRRSRSVGATLLLACSLLFSAPREASAVVISNSDPVIEQQDITDFLDLAYTVLLGRAPDATGATAFGALLVKGDDTTNVATDIDTSVEYYSRLVTAYYQEFLDRTPAPSEISYWVSQILSGATDESVIAALLGSPEYQAVWRANTPAELIDQMFHDLLGRSLNPAESPYWLALLASTNATTVALDIESSTEYRSDLITQLYEDDLDRSPGPASVVPYWLGLLDAGATDEQVIAELVGSAEFLDDAEQLGGPTDSLRELEFKRQLTGAPEPSAFWLLAIGMVSLAGLYRLRSAGNDGDSHPPLSLAIGGWKARPISQGK
jgi:Domain of unknown function (DUF4214)